MIVRIGFSRPIALVIHFTALVPILLYSLHHIFREVAVIGVLLLLSGILLMCSIYTVYRNKENDFILQLFIISISLALIATCYYLGIRGALFVFPLLSAYFYSFSYKYALWMSCCAGSICMLALFNSLDQITIARLSLGLGLSIFFNASFASLVNQQKSSLEKEAMEDYLTGLLNRRSFNLRLDSEIPGAIKHNKILALLYIDLDNFKQINDNYGHDVGDVLLQEASKRMQLSIRPEDMLFSLSKSPCVARLAGDEFGLVLSNTNSIHDVELVVNRLLNKLEEPYSINTFKLNVNASIGIAIVGKDGNTAELLMQNADAAMYKAKVDGKKRYQFFNDEIAEKIVEYSTIEKELQCALTEKLFYLNYMPIYHCNSLEIAGVEVLIRCNSGPLCEYGPEKFIPVAERCGLIFDIDLWVIESTFQQIAEIKKEIDIDELFFCINISAKELLNKNFVLKLNALLDKYNIQAKQIELEITETSLVGDLDKSVITLEKIKETGITLSLDDFGTGYTAFNQLTRYPVSTLKIDRSFVNDIESGSEKKRSMVNIISSLANLYELSIIAEGVETKHQLDYLKKLDCQYVQGYYLNKPMAWLDFRAILIEHAHSSSSSKY